MDKSTDFYDELLSKTDIIKLISEYVPLKKKGTSYWGCCPFHHEKTPSFSVSDTKQVYHCFGCGQSGNAITFLKNIESVESGEAVKILAKRAGLELPKTSFLKTDNAETLKKRERLYALMRDAARHYHENLFTPSGKQYLDYLSSRGIDNRLIVKFGLGCSTGGSEIINYLKTLGYTEPEMKEAGLIETGTNGNYDVFYSRLMIPIINNYGEVVAFGGRTLVKNPDFAKYRNSSKTVIFDKSKTIYGINLLKKLKQKQRIDYIIMAEGYMDVIALHKGGFNTAVASMGTALTTQQAKLIKNYATRIYISYDGDTAGQTATLRGLDILAEAGLNVRVILLPDGMDPDDIITKKGSAFYQKLLDNSLALTEYKLNVLKNIYDITDTEGKAKYAVEAVKIIKNLKNPVEQEDYLKIVQKLTNYTMSALQKQADITVIDTNPDHPTALNEDLSKGGSSGEDKALKFILACMANDESFVDYGQNIEDYVDDEFYKSLIVFFKNGREEGLRRSPSVLYERVDGDAEKKLLDSILSYDFVAGDNEEKYISCINSVILNSVKRERDYLAELYDKTKDKDVLLKFLSADEKFKQLKIGGDSNE